MIYYNLAYGSNMSLNRLLARLPNATRIGVSTVTGFTLTFDKQGFDGSGKCNALKTDNHDDVLYGVLYQINNHEKAILDEIEGPRYDNQQIVVTNECGKQFNAYCYVANTLCQQHLPYDWYLKHVLTGALEAKLPQQYIDNIRAQATQTDTDSARAEREFSIYK
ncbi:hypothetical protein AN214_01464 [Pseudoalteromonas sp. P1-9]|uniref:gamma-glutamylcyclotransferase family protein n=1 Tax=Pseudoalteromonas sp. P1-9 TaxID=1710354 RepID=UPI0006D5DF31|nr:gamma-glutamylcyclotransferase family protein [Pseudoalteromonas sp. P1-9]KPV96638.1 hypothetical protein AN214_01464 [Pseudoalteromonas sp. P1-9]